MSSFSDVKLKIVSCRPPVSPISSAQIADGLARAFKLGFQAIAFIPRSTSTRPSSAT